MSRVKSRTERKGKITQENVGHIITNRMICVHGNGDGHYELCLRTDELCSVHYWFLQLPPLNQD